MPGNSSRMPYAPQGVKEFDDDDMMTDCMLIPTCASLWEIGVLGEAALYVPVEPVA